MAKHRYHHGPSTGPLPTAPEPRPAAPSDRSAAEDAILARIDPTLFEQELARRRAEPVTDVEAVFDRLEKKLSASDDPVGPRP